MYLPPTNNNYKIEEEIQNDQNDLISSINDNINSYPDNASDSTENIDNDMDNYSENNHDFSQEPRKSNQIRKSIRTYYSQEWVSLANTIQDETTPWASYGDPNLRAVL